MATPNIGGRPTGRPVGSWLFFPQSLHRQRWEPFFLPLRTVRPLLQWRQFMLSLQWGRTGSGGSATENALRR